MAPAEGDSPAGEAGQSAATSSAQPGPADPIGVTVVCALAPHRLLQARVELPPGATALDAWRASGLAAQLPPGMLDTLVMGLWGRECSPAMPLRADDRLELTRPLIVDPKEARRLRYRRDGLRPKRKGSAAV